MDSHETQCEQEYWSDLRADTGTLFFPDRNVISTIDHGEQIDHKHTGKGKSKHTSKGKGNQVDVVETNQPSETASTMSAIESGDADESMNMVKTAKRQNWFLNGTRVEKHSNCSSFWKFACHQSSSVMLEYCSTCCVDSTIRQRYLLSWIREWTGVKLRTTVKKQILGTSLSPCG